MKRKLKSAFYWVKFQGEWIVAKYDSKEDYWYICGNERYFETEDFQEVDYDHIKP